MPPRPSAKPPGGESESEAEDEIVVSLDRPQRRPLDPEPIGEAPSPPAKPSSSPLPEPVSSPPPKPSTSPLFEPASSSPFKHGSSPPPESSPSPVFEPVSNARRSTRNARPRPTAELPTLSSVKPPSNPRRSLRNAPAQPVAGPPSSPLSSPLSEPPSDIDRPSKRKRTQVGAPKRKVVPRAANKMSVDQAHKAAHDRITELPVVNLPESSKNMNSAAWDAVKDQIKQTTKVHITKLPPTLVPSEVAPVRDKRDFQIHFLEEEEMMRDREDSQTGRASGDPQPVRCWRVGVRDFNNPASDPVSLFQPRISVIDKNPKKVILRAGPLTLTVCPTRAEAEQVVMHACNLLDRHPGSIKDLERDNQGVMSAAKRMIETLAIYSFDPTFANVDGEWKSEPLKQRVANFNSTYAWPLVNVKITHFPKRTNPYGLSFWCVSADGTPHDIITQPNIVDFDKVRSFFEKNEGCPDDFHWKAARELHSNKFHYQDIGLGDDEWDLVLSMFAYVQYKVWGKSGTHEAILIYAQAILDAFTSSNWRRPKQTGIVGGQRGFNMYLSHPSIRLTPSTVVAHALEGNVPAIVVNNKSKVALSYVFQQMYYAFSIELSLENMWRVGGVAADLVNSWMPSIMSRERMIDLHCQCKSPEDRANIGHYCMLDFRLQRCCEMGRLPDGRLVCSKCLESTGSTVDTVEFGIRALLRPAARNAVRSDCRSRGTEFDKDLFNSIVHSLESSILDADEGEWRDAYFGGIRRMTDASYHDICLRALTGRTVISHFLTLTVDAFQSILRDKLGKTWLHHPLNVVLTVLCLNHLKGIYPPVIIALFKDARQQFLHEEETNTRDVEWWKAWNTAMDHAWMISKLVPYSRAARFRYKMDEGRYTLFRKMWKSGKFTGRVNTKAFRSKILISRMTSLGTGFTLNRPVFADAKARWEARGGRKKMVRWTSDDKARLQELVTGIENSTDFNKHGLKPKHGEDGAPWLWRQDHMPQDWSWSHLQDEFYWTYVRMDESCDPENDSSRDGDETLCLTCLILWCISGGRDLLFGCELEFWSTSPLSMSLGRATHVDPASPLWGGWRNRHPRSLTEFCLADCSLVFETKAGNFLRFNYPKELLDEILHVVADSRDYNPDFYDAPQYQLNPIQFPLNMSEANQSPHRVALFGAIETSDDSEGESAEESAQESEEELEDELTDDLVVGPEEDEDVQLEDDEIGENWPGDDESLQDDDDEDDDQERPRKKRNISGSAPGDRPGFQLASNLAANLAQKELEVYHQTLPHITVRHGQSVRLFAQTRPNADPHQGLWTAVAMALPGTKRSDVDSTIKQIQQRVQDLWAAVMDDQLPNNKARVARRALYSLLQEHYPTIVTQIQGQADCTVEIVQVIADALDIQLSLHAPHQIKKSRDDAPAAATEWSLQARGQTFDQTRIIHLACYLYTETWTVLESDDRRGFLIPESLTRQPMPGHDVVVRPLARLPPNEADKTDGHWPDLSEIQEQPVSISDVTQAGDNGAEDDLHGDSGRPASQPEVQHQTTNDSDNESMLSHDPDDDFSAGSDAYNDDDFASPEPTFPDRPPPSDQPPKQPPPEVEIFDFSADLQFFTQARDAGENLQFSRPMVEMFNRFDEVAREQQLPIGKVNINGHYLELVIPVAKPTMLGSPAYISEAAVDELVQEAIKSRHSPPPRGSVLLDVATARHGLQYINTGIEDLLGNPLSDYDHHSINRVVFVLGTGAHFFVVAFNFQEDVGIVEMWNSSSAVKGPDLKLIREMGVLWAKYLAKQPQIDKPELEWSTEIVRRPQTTQPDGSGDCGPLSIYAATQTLYNEDIDVKPASEAAEWGVRLRHVCFKRLYDVIMDANLPDYVQEAPAEEPAISTSPEANKPTASTSPKLPDVPSPTSSPTDDQPMGEANDESLEETVSRLVAERMQNFEQEMQVKEQALGKDRQVFEQQKQALNEERQAFEIEKQRRAQEENTEAVAREEHLERIKATVAQMRAEGTRNLHAANVKEETANSKKETALRVIEAGNRDLEAANRDLEAAGQEISAAQALLSAAQAFEALLPREQ